MDDHAAPERTVSGHAVTIQDIAREAGVSKMTVSQVLNNRGRISDATRERVLGIAKDLGYVANAAARSLRGGRTNLVGLVVQELGNAYYAEILRGASSAIQERGLDVILYTASYDPQRERRSVAALSGGLTDGLVLITPFEDVEALQALGKLRTPVVLVNHFDRNTNLPEVNADNYQGIKDAVRHLHDLGHRRVAYLTGGGGASSVIRQRGYHDALHELGLPPAGDLLVEGDYSQPTGRALTHRLLDRADPPTAILAANDFVAYGVLEAVRERGLSVPTDISVVGFDDIPMSSQVSPALTTIRHPLEDIGRTAVQLLLDALEGNRTEGTVTLPSQLVVRQSTGPPR
ncbi:LacI family DNA-binding transcriptional regulator [Deinococcus pimensis]|uniref:LacI family DNA-binding transcriptional regulator n=1 Tax=Deinococcus pimensis TaxID=309888 RepID=UPI0009FD4D39|nr:LacI family DNA-binding transcriptional regulator [Deinococcus pimensis]